MIKRSVFLALLILMNFCISRAQESNCDLQFAHTGGENDKGFMLHLYTDDQSQFDLNKIRCRIIQSIR
jgi:hypothetical protein